jgi:hypothetical protein
MFTGLSQLRAKEKKAAPVSEESLKLQAYLAAQYGAGSEDQKKKKKKKKPKEASGVRLLDEDVSGFRAVKGKREKLEEVEDDGEEDEGDQVLQAFLPSLETCGYCAAADHFNVLRGMQINR